MPRCALGRWGLLLLLACGTASCNRPSTPTLAASFRFDPTTLDENRALAEVGDFVALGPRHAGTPGARKAADYLAERLRATGLDAEVDSFEDATPNGTKTFHNVIGTIPGTTGKRLIVSSHFDTKSGLGASFQGANDSGSSTGLLIELARVLRAQVDDAYRGPEIQFVFFDGEEAKVRYGHNDGFHGSKHHAQQLVEAGEVDQVLAVINLDMVGDRDLTITVPYNSSPALRPLVLEAAHAEGARKHFSLFPHRLGDDHEPFLDVGIPAINLIDFQYGSRPGRNDYWHTLEDNMEKLSAQSLGTVGRVTIRLINEVLTGRDLRPNYAL